MRQLTPRRGYRYVLAVLALTVPLAGCGGGSDDGGKKTDAKSTAPTTATTPATQAPQVFERVSTEQRAKYLAALTAIDPELTKKEARALTRGVNICYKLYYGENPAALLKYSAETYMTSPDKGRPILEAAKRWMCTSKELRDHHRKVTGIG